MFKKISSGLWTLQNQFLKSARFNSQKMQTESKQNVSYLNQEVAKSVDQQLMEEYGWSLESLMELAGQFQQKLHLSK